MVLRPIGHLHGMVFIDFSDLTFLYLFVVFILVLVLDGLEHPVGGEHGKPHGWVLDVVLRVQPIGPSLGVVSQLVDFELGSLVTGGHYLVQEPLDEFPGRQGAPRVFS